ncbi:MAG: hypothetical protein WD055_04875 [Candidatus Dependentiae bacterium]
MVVPFLSLVLLLSCLSGCSKQVEQDEQSHAEVMYHGQEAKRSQLYQATTVQHQKEIDVDAVEFDEINFDYVWTVDIPIPVDATEKKNYCQAKADVYTVGYSTSQHQDELIAFYKQQMELLGWHCWWNTESIEGLMLFEKPHKQCAISIRPSNSRKKSDIVVMQKTVASVA